MNGTAEHRGRRTADLENRSALRLLNGRWFFRQCQRSRTTKCLNPCIMRGELCNNPGVNLRARRARKPVSRRAFGDAAALNLTLMGQTPAPTPAFADGPKRTPCLLTSEGS